MRKGFWKKLADKASPPVGGEKRPILVSASMANVTDVAFRLMLVKHSKFGGKGFFDKNGKFTCRSGERVGGLVRPKPCVGGPDVIWTEFVSCDGLCSEGKNKLLQDLIFDKSERPIVVQFFGANPEIFYKCALMAQKLGFDGIDINMGCPDKGIVRQGAGAALIKNPKLAQEIIKETLRGAGKLPVSVKTRIGFNEIEYKNWIPKLLKMNLAALIIHGRTKKEMSKVPAHWDIIGEIVKMRNKLKSQTLIIGNGDVASLADAQEKYKKYKVDGIMIGRALLGNPYFFSGDWQSKKKEISLKTKLKLALEHTKLFRKIFGDKKHFDIMKKHYKAYVSGFDDAKKMRMRLMKTKSLGEVEKVLKQLIEH